MPRFYTYRDGVEWGWFQVLTEDPGEWFARAIQQNDAPGLSVEEIAVGTIGSARDHKTKLGGRFENRATGHLWIAVQERS